MSIGSNLGKKINVFASEKKKEQQTKTVVGITWLKFGMGMFTWWNLWAIFEFYFSVFSVSSKTKMKTYFFHHHHHARKI